MKATAERIQLIISGIVSKNMKVTRDNIITQSLFSAGGTLSDNDKEIIDRQISAYELDQSIKKQFRHLTNRDLVTRINGLPDFKWDDEGYELSRRIKASNGKFEAKMIGNNIAILKDEK